MEMFFRPCVRLVPVPKVGRGTNCVSDLKESRKSRNCAEAYSAYAAQKIPQAWGFPNSVLGLGDRRETKS